MTYLVGIDPGLATGIAVGHYTDDHPYRLIEAAVTHNGVDGFFRDWWSDHTDYYEGWGNLEDNGAWGPREKVLIVVEGFRLRGGNQFVASLDGVEIIGLLKALVQPDRLHIQWPHDKALVPDMVLKRGGLWQTGKSVGHSDGRDANDAIIHALAFLMKNRHAPTIAHYFGGDDV